MVHKRKGYHQVSEDDFTKIKALTNAGVSSTIIRKVTGRSYGVIGTIQKSKDFNSYRENVKAIVLKYAKKEIHEDQSDGFTYPQIGAVLVEINNNIIKLNESVQSLKNSHGVVSYNS